MNKHKTTRHALTLSLLSLLLCLSMLVGTMGTIFAWFTDSVISGNNKIVSGNLDIELEYSKDMGSWASVEGKTDLFSENLWNPVTPTIPQGSIYIVLQQMAVCSATPQEELCIILLLGDPYVIFEPK